MVADRARDPAAVGAGASGAPDAAVTAGDATTVLAAADSGPCAWSDRGVRSTGADADVAPSMRTVGLSGAVLGACASDEARSVRVVAISAADGVAVIESLAGDAVSFATGAAEVAASAALASPADSCGADAARDGACARITTGAIRRGGSVGASVDASAGAEPATGRDCTTGDCTTG